MIQHTIAITIDREQQTVTPDEIQTTITAMRRWLTDQLAERFGTDGHLTYRWELTVRMLGGATMLHTWHVGEPLPRGSRVLTLIGQGFAHAATAGRHDADG